MPSLAFERNGERQPMVDVDRLQAGAVDPDQSRGAARGRELELHVLVAVEPDRGVALLHGEATPALAEDRGGAAGLGYRRRLRRHALGAREGEEPHASAVGGGAVT